MMVAMNDEKEQGKRAPLDIRRMIRGLNVLLSAGPAVGKAMEQIIEEAHAAVNCNHLFLSRFDATSQLFRALAWRSSVNPGDVPLAQKFMGNSYLSGQPVIVHNLSQFNYRLRPGIARLGFMSMVGVPILSGQRVVGVLEAFSEQADHFSDLDADVLTLFAAQAGLALERADLQREAGYLRAENDFLLEALKLEHASTGSLLYKVGETFASVLGIDGIAVFGIEEQQDNPLQEVMAQGFSMADIGRLKSLYGKDYPRQLPSAPGEKPGGLITKQSFRQGGPGAAKQLFTVPIVHKRILHGLVVFYWKQLDKITDMNSVEHFIEQMVGHIRMVLGRQDIFANIQRISFSDILTGLANRRLFDYVLDREVKKARRVEKPVSLLMVDVDNFKQINDDYGHVVGDGVLEILGGLIQESVRDIDLAARYGGEEFAIILPATAQDEAVAIAERVRKRVADRQFPAGKNGFINVTISIGGITDSCKDIAGGSAERLILAADQAMYQAKQMGRNITVVSNNC